MGFVEHISDYRSLAIVGLEKNTGKTECLNYILRRIKKTAQLFALTSVGIDGENRDQVCQTPKPEIVVPEGMIFVTSEKHFREKRLVAEILDISEEQTALGRLITARAKSSVPSSVIWKNKKTAPPERRCFLGRSRFWLGLFC